MSLAKPLVQGDAGMELWQLCCMVSDNFPEATQEEVEFIAVSAIIEKIKRSKETKPEEEAVIYV